MKPDPFLESREWRTLRMEVLAERGGRCEACGRTAANGVVINVDHIKPRYHYPKLALEKSNLQVLCDACNHGKGSWNQTDWRPESNMRALIDKAAAKYDTSKPAGKVEFLNELLPAVANIANAVERAAWMPAIVEAGGLDERAAQDELRRVLGRSPLPAPILPERPKRITPPERWLLALAVVNAPGIGAALQQLSEESIGGLVAGPVLAAAKGLTASGKKLSASVLLEAVPNEEARRIVTEVAVEATPGSGVSPADCVRELRRLELESRLTALRRRIATAPDGGEDALLREKNEVARKLASL